MIELSYAADLMKNIFRQNHKAVYDVCVGGKQIVVEFYEPSYDVAKQVCEDLENLIQLHFKVRDNGNIIIFQRKM